MSPEELNELAADLRLGAVDVEGDGWHEAAKAMRTAAAALSQQGRDAVPDGMVLVQISDLKLLSNHARAGTYNPAEYLARQRAHALIDTALATQPKERES